MKLKAAWQSIKMKWLSLICLLGCGFIACVVYLPYWRPDFWIAQAQLNDMKGRLRAKNEPVEFRDLEPNDPYGYQIGEEVEAILLKMKKVSWDTLEAIRSAPPISDEGRELLTRAVDDNHDVMATFGKLEELDKCRFRYDFSTNSPASILLPMVDPISKISYLWRAQAVLAAEKEEYSTAFEAIIELADTAEALKCDRFLVSQMVRTRIGGNALDSLEEILALTAPDQQQFEAIDNRLVKMEKGFRIADSLLFERSALFTNLANIGHPEVRQMIANTYGLSGDGGLFSLEPPTNELDRWGSLSYLPELMKQQIWALETIGQAAEIVDLPGNQASEDWNKINSNIQHKLKSSEGSAIYQLFPAISQLRRQGFAYRQRLMAARLAMRIVRRYEDQRSLPVKPVELVDPLMPEVPLGLWNGEAPELIFTDDGFTVGYSDTEPEDDNASTISVTRQFDRLP